MKTHIVNAQTGENIIRDLTTDEQTILDTKIAEWETSKLDREIKKLRIKRNILLADSDWQVTMAKEKGTSLSTAFKNWRQALRDATDGLDTVDKVNNYTFPTKP